MLNLCGKIIFKKEREKTIRIKSYLKKKCMLYLLNKMKAA